MATCQWPASVPGNWQRAPALTGRLRLCTKSMLFDPDDVRVPIVRLPFASVQLLTPPGRQGGGGESSFSLVVTLLVQMRANLEDVPYTFIKGSPTEWRFQLCFAKLDTLLPQAHKLLAISQKPRLEQESLLQVRVCLKGSAEPSYV